MRALLPNHRPALALAPMQDITHLAFMQALVPRSLPDWFVTEFFRVHPDSSLEKPILKAILEHNTDRPVFAQMIGGDVASMVRVAGELGRYPIAGIDLNLGCPAPIVCRKRAGGGLLRQPERLGDILARLRAGIAGCFTVKTRLGYEHADEFGRLLEIFRPLGLDGLTVHARTVAQGYQGAVAHGWVREAVAAMPCPVVANGNIVDVATGLAYQRLTGAAGLMVGRGAIRNPWMFDQLRAAWGEDTAVIPTHRHLLRFVEDLWEGMAAADPRYHPHKHVQRMKRTVGYICHGLGEGFEHDLRRSREVGEFWAICRRHLEHDAPLPARPPGDSRLFSGFRGLLDDAGPRGSDAAARSQQAHLLHQQIERPGEGDDQQNQENLGGEFDA